ncbi:hypothetical protein LINPERHAP2_LOCUS29199 [Linum perenne]
MKGFSYFPWRCTNLVAYQEACCSYLFFYY